jgi:DNA polymerase elongation subunit (family B)
LLSIGLAHIQRVLQLACKCDNVVELLMDFRNKQPGKIQEYVANVLDLREYDVPYHVRFAIDNGKS